MNGLLAAVTQRKLWNGAQIRELVHDYCVRVMVDWYANTTEMKPTPQVDELRAMRIFATDKQQTWLVASSLLLACVLDDRRREQPQVQWLRRLKDVLPVEADAAWSETAGVLHFGDSPKGWLYTKALFASEPVDVAITRFLLDGA